MSEPKHVYFEEVGLSASRLTKIWDVRSKHDDSLLGEIKWYAPWRQYSFVVDLAKFKDVKELVNAASCLRDIANFCEIMTKIHKDKVRTRSKEARSS
jgi:hypothetical protein